MKKTPHFFYGRQPIIVGDEGTAMSMPITVTNAISQEIELKANETKSDYLKRYKSTVGCFYPLSRKVAEDD